MSDQQSLKEAAYECCKNIRQDEINAAAYRPIIVTIEMALVSAEPDHPGGFVRKRCQTPWNSSDLSFSRQTPQIFSHTSEWYGGVR
jgi:hypothetical protein